MCKIKYFPLDSAFRIDRKVMELQSDLGYTGIGLFLTLLSVLSAEDKEDYSLPYVRSEASKGTKEYKRTDSVYRLAKQLQAKESDLRAVIEDYGLFVIEDGRFWSERLRKHCRGVGASEPKEAQRSTKASEAPATEDGETPKRVLSEEARAKLAEAGRRGGKKSIRAKASNKPQGLNDQASNKPQRGTIGGEKEREEDKELEIEIHPQTPEGLSVVVASAPTSESQETEKSKKKGAKAVERAEFPERMRAVWNAVVATELGRGRVGELSAKRYQHATARMKQLQGATSDEKIADFEALCRKALASDFVRSGSWFSFDWLIKSEDNLLKLREGNYDNAKPQPPRAEAKPANFYRNDPNETDEERANRYGSIMREREAKSDALIEAWEREHGIM